MIKNFYTFVITSRFFREGLSDWQNPCIRVGVFAFLAGLVQTDLPLQISCLYRFPHSCSSFSFNLCVDSVKQIYASQRISNEAWPRNADNATDRILPARW
jgi:hypothetical protein